MSYLTVTKIAADPAMILRITACAASEGISDPQHWAQERMWELSSQPGWGAAYASAELAHDADPQAVPPPAENEAAITDGMILSAVQTVRATELVAPTE